MKKYIVASYDGSKYADTALQTAVELAKAFNDEVVLINIQPNLNMGNIRLFFSEKEIKMYEQEKGMKVLERAQQYLQSAGVSFQSVVRDGAPHEEICKYAEEVNARYIVVGTRGLGAIKGTLLGSVSKTVLGRATCPVVAVPLAE